MTTKIISILLLIVIGVSLIPIVGDSVANADIVSTNETSVAVENTTDAEVLTTLNAIDSINAVTVNGVTLDVANYSFVTNQVTLVALASDIDDEIVVYYDYTSDLGTATTSLLNLLPLLFVILIVAGAVKYVKFN